MNSQAHRRKLHVTVESWPVRGEFRISRGSCTEIEVVIATIEEQGVIGLGEASPILRYGKNAQQVAEQIIRLQIRIEQGLTRDDLQDILPPGSARNALDLALWDLEAKLSGKSACKIGGLTGCKPVVTAYTISLDTPEQMELAARKRKKSPLLKIKLTGKQNVERVKAVRRGAPNARLIADANEAWTPEYYRKIINNLALAGLTMIEQPLPADKDDCLRTMPRPIPICADESCHDAESLYSIQDRYDMINIKLDKTGGLTEALKLQRVARQQGLKIMVGCMLATSLGIAPALILAQDAEIIDLDGHLLLARDRPNELIYQNHLIHPPTPELWG